MTNNFIIKQDFNRDDLYRTSIMLLTLTIIGVSVFFFV